MAYEHSTRLDYLGTRMQGLHSNSLVYTRGPVDITITNFTPEKIDVEQMQALGIVLITEKWQDFVFSFASLADLDPQTPQRGDTLTWGTLVFEVAAINDELYNFTTSSRKRIRIHAKQVG